MDLLANQIDLGKTWYGVDGTINTSDYGNSIMQEGVKRTFTPYTKLAETVPYRQAEVKAILVRNVSGLVLIPGLAVTWAAGYRGRRVDNYSVATATDVAGIVDPWIAPATGVRNGDLFWLIVRGPTLVAPPTTAASFVGNTWAAGDLVYAATGTSTANSTGASTNADEGGRLQNWSASATATITGVTVNTTLALVAFLANKVGRVMSAATSGQSASKTGILVFLNTEQYC